MKKTLKIVSLTMAAAMAFACTACTGAAETVETSGSEAETSEMEIPNPWSDIDTLDAAAEAAGIEPLMIAEDGITVDGNPLQLCCYEYMDGMVQAHYSIGAAEMYIRKGKIELAQDGDISGDYNTYVNEWTQNIKGLEVNCAGTNDGEAHKVVWAIGDYAYAIMVEGAGGEEYGLDADSISSLINGIQ
jgi:hypothetical protein